MFPRLQFAPSDRERHHYGRVLHWALPSASEAGAASSGAISRPRPPRLTWPPFRPAHRPSSAVHSCAVPFSSRPGRPCWQSPAASRGTWMPRALYVCSHVLSSVVIASHQAFIGLLGAASSIPLFAFPASRRDPDRARPHPRGESRGAVVWAGRSDTITPSIIKSSAIGAAEVASQTTVMEGLTAALFSEAQAGAADYYSRALRDRMPTLEGR